MIEREPIGTGLPERSGDAGAFDEAVGRTVRDPHLVRALYRAISTVLASPERVALVGTSPSGVFDYSLSAAKTKIETRGMRMKVLRRLLLHGADPDQDLERQPELTLKESESCINFIYFSMVNRFQGELGELIAVEPVYELMCRLVREGAIPADARLYWGEAIQERVRSAGSRPGRWAKGADGLIAAVNGNRVHIHGIVEVKSMRRPASALVRQIDRHALRSANGLRLCGQEFPGECVVTAPEREPLRILVMPADWELSRRWERVLNERGSESIRFPERESTESPERPIRTERCDDGSYQITLGWSEEALAESAYDMTFSYMREVGRSAYAEADAMPKDWDMSPEDAGQNAIKAALYYLPLQGLREVQAKLAARLYRVYGFTYALAVHDQTADVDSDLNAVDARALYEKALAQFRTAGNNRGIGNALCRLASLARREGKLCEAKELYEEALPYFQAIGARLDEAKLHACLGDVCVALPDGEAARAAFGLSAAIYEGLGHKHGAADSLIGFGDAEGILGNLDEAQSAYTRATELASSVRDHLCEANALSSRAELALYRRDFASARDDCSKALVSFRRYGAAKREAIVLRNLGTTERQLGDEGAALRYLYLALRLSYRRRFLAEEAETRGALGDLEKSRGQNERALRHYRAAFQLFVEATDPASQGHILVAMAKVETELGQTQSARERYERALELFAAISDEAGTAKVRAELEAIGSRDRG